MLGFLALLKLGSIWSRIGGAISGACNAAAAWVVRNPIPALISALALACGVLGWALNREREQVTAAKAVSAKIIAAQAGATAAQIQVNQAPAIDSAAIARQSDAQAPSYYAAVAAAADAHRVVVQPATCPVSAASVLGPDPAQPSVHGPGDSPIMVSRSKLDDDLIVAAAGRAAKMHQDAMTMIERGDAVPVDAAPNPASTEGN